jgi:hypothetical protein
LAQRLEASHFDFMMGMAKWMGWREISTWTDYLGTINSGQGSPDTEHQSLPPCGANNGSSTRVTIEQSINIRYDCFS